MGLVAALIKGGAGILATRSQTRIAAMASDRVRDGVVGRLLLHGLADPSPVAVARCSSRIREVQGAVHDGVLAIARAIAQLVPIAIALLLVSPWLSIVATTILVPFSVLLSRARRGWRTQHERFLVASDELHEEMDDLIRHADLWRTYGTGHQVRIALDRIAARVIATQSRAETVRAALSASNEILGAFALVLALLAGARWSAYVSDGTIIAFAAVFFMAYKPLRDLGDARTCLHRGEDALRVLRSISLAQTLSEEPQAAPAWPSRAGELRVDQVAVPLVTPAVSFCAPAGSIVAIVGPTGIGKSTLLRTLLGLEPHASGSIWFHNVPLRPGHVGPTQRPFAWVPQDAPIVGGTLDDNFVLAGTTETDATSEMEKLGASLLRSALSGVKLGAAGRALSGGERRWIAVARALATRMPVLLLDEPTVGLDAGARQRMLDTLAAVRGQRTMIIVSHDDDVVKLADRVVEMKGGPASR